MKKDELGDEGEDGKGCGREVVVVQEKRSSSSVSANADGA